MAFGFRCLSALVAFFINIAFPLHQPLQMTVGVRPHLFWDTFARYDSGWYEGIARNGYSYLAGGRSNIAYFPVYPLLMRYVGRLFGHHHAAFYYGGIVVSWTAFVLAAVALYYVARLDLPRRAAERAVVLTTIFPFAFFFGTVYGTSTFLLFTALAFYGLRTRRWLLGGFSGAIAIATWTPAIVIWPALAWVAWRSAEPTRIDRAWAVGAALLTTSGFVAYCTYIYSVSGNPLEWAATLQRWGYHPGGAPWSAPLTLLQKLGTDPYTYLTSDPMALYDTLYGGVSIAFLALAPVVWWKLGAGYGLFMLLSLLVPLSSGVFEGMGRYCSVLFPAFFWLASIRSRFVSQSITVLFAMLYTLGLSLFTTLHPLF